MSDQGQANRPEESQDPRDPEPQEQSEQDTDSFAFLDTQEALPRDGMVPPAGPVPYIASTRYRIGGVLGQGGMAVVYEGYDTSLRRPVAVKVLRPELAMSLDHHERFFAEARVLSQMNHPGLVPVFEMGELDGYGAFYAMKRVEGQTFRDILKGYVRADFHNPQVTARLIGIFEHVCQTMAYAHAQGVVHRDLKPENIMVDDYGVVLVMDWGLSKRLFGDDGGSVGYEPTEVGVVRGTPAYMSPEQASGKVEEVDFRTDVFALGIMLYEILTGQFPFAGKTRTEVLEQIMQRNPAHPRRENRSVGRVISAICMKALDKDPEKRYSDAKELEEDIRLYRNYMPTSAYAPQLSDYIANWIGRHPALSTAIGTALVLTMAFGGFGYHRWAAAQIRLQEQQLAEQRAQATEARIRHAALDKMSDFLTKIGESLDELDSQIVTLENERAAAPAGDPAAELLDARLAELKCVRTWHAEYAQRTATMIITMMSDETAPTLAELDPRLMDVIREQMLNQARSLVRIGEYYNAHNRIWRYVVQSERIGWTDAQKSELLELLGQVESKMREGKGPDFKLPDWSKYDPQAFSPGIYDFLSKGESGGAPPDDEQAPAALEEPTAPEPVE